MRYVKTVFPDPASEERRYVKTVIFTYQKGWAQYRKIGGPNFPASELVELTISRGNPRDNTLFAGYEFVDFDIVPMPAPPRRLPYPS
jgi:hypothetical protein